MSGKPPHGSLATAFAAVQQAIRGMGQTQNVTLVAAGKGQSAGRLAEAIGLGLTHFGENRVQEAAEKWPELKQRHPGVRLHLIGPLQSNKVAEAVALFDAIETVDRPKIADALAAEMAKQGRRPNLLIQVNIGEEAQKHGVMPAQLPGLLEHCRGAGLAIGGLMAVPPASVNPAPYFALMKKLADRHGLHALSMGMSGDYVTAIRLGATAVRLGTALFGPRG